MIDSHRSKNVVMVSIGLAEDGGGVSLVGRLIARTTATYCQKIGVPFRILHLSYPTELLPDLEIKHFHDNQLQLALEIWASQLSHKRAYMIFDHLGPARAQAYLPRNFCAPYLLFMHGIEVWKPLAWDRRAAIQKAKLRLTNSHFTHQQILRFSPWLPHTNVQHLALEEREPYGELDEPLLEAVGTNYFLIVGRMSMLERYKGHDSLIDAMLSLVRFHPSVRLVIVGNGDDVARLQARVSDCALDDYVMFTGFVTETTLQALYRRCRAFVMPSKGEGFGLAFLEAMRASKPCVALANTAPSEIILDGITGFLLDEPQAEQLVDVLQRLLTDDTLVDNLGRAGYQRWQEHFSYDAFVQNFSLQLDTLLG